MRIFIAEKGIDIPMKPVDLGAKEQFSDAYRAVNPRSQVPALVLAGGPVIGEVPAIWRYLEEAYPQTPLLGKTAESKALVTMWERRAELDGFAPVMEGVRNAVAGLKGRALSGPHAYEQIPELVERSKQRVANFFPTSTNGSRGSGSLPATNSRRRTSPRWSRSTSRPTRSRCRFHQNMPHFTDGMTKSLPGRAPPHKTWGRRFPYVHAAFRGGEEKHRSDFRASLPAVQVAEAM